MSAENGVICGGICAAAHGNNSRKATTVAGITLVRSFTSLSLYGSCWPQKEAGQQFTPKAGIDGRKQTRAKAAVSCGAEQQWMAPRS